MPQKLQYRIRHFYIAHTKYHQKSRNTAAYYLLTDQDFRFFVTNLVKKPREKNNKHNLELEKKGKKL